MRCAPPSSAVTSGRLKLPGENDIMCLHQVASMDARQDLNSSSAKTSLSLAKVLACTSVTSALVREGVTRRNLENKTVDWSADIAARALKVENIRAGQEIASSR
jgi:hypothetical protein